MLLEFSQKIDTSIFLPYNRSKKNSQIFITYAGFYYKHTLQDRKKKLKGYNFTCDCEACVESWPPVFYRPHHNSTLETMLYNNCKSIIDALNVKKTDFSKEDVKKLCKTILEASQRLKQPTFLMAALEDSLVLIYSRIYGWKSPIHAFGKC